MRSATAGIALQLFDFLTDRARLFLGVPAGGDLHLLPCAFVRAQGLAQPPLVMGYEVRGGRQNMAGRPVIAFEPNDPRAREVVLETKDVVDLGAAPAINRLVVVAHAADVLELARLPWRSRCALGQQAKPKILRNISVLIFVD